MKRAPMGALFGWGTAFGLELVPHPKGAPAGELAVSDSEQTEGEYLTTLGIFEQFPFRHGCAATLSP